MITSAQIRAARALLRWSAQELADHSGTGVATVLRLEQQDGVPTGRSHTLLDLQKTLEVAGVEFIGTPDDRPGVRLALKADVMTPIHVGTTGKHPRRK